MELSEDEVDEPAEVEEDEEQGRNILEPQVIVAFRATGNCGTCERKKMCCSQNSWAEMKKLHFCRMETISELNPSIF